MVYFYKIFIKTEKLHKQEQSCHVERPQWTFVLWCLWFSLQVYFFTLGEGNTEKVAMIRSGYSSLILLIRRVPIPDPVPPPRLWAIWKPCRQSQASASLRNTSRTVSTNSAPSV